jgi:uncharacterized protein DUF4920
MKSARHLLPCALLLAGSLDAPSSAAEAAILYGQKLQGLPPVRLEEILAKPEAGKMVRVEGTIEKVCQNKGCWLELKQGTKSVHVTFAGYSFFVPKDSATKHVALEGRVVVKEPERSDVAHKEAEGAGPAAGARVSLEATGVLIAP